MKTQTELYKLCKYSIGFALFLCFILLLIEYSLALLVKQSDNQQTGKVNLIMAHKIDPKILVLGSSVAEVSFNSNLLAKKMNCSVYNCAIDGTTILQSQFITDEFLDYSNQCEQIVIGLAFFSFSEKGSMTEPSRFLAHFSNQYVKANIKNSSPSLYRKLQYVPFYTFTQTKQTYYKNAAIGLINIVESKPLAPDPLNGFVPHDTPWTGEHINQPQFYSDSINFSKKSINNYIHILEKIKSNNIQPVLTITPMYINGQRLFVNYTEFIKTAHAIASEADCKIIDFSKSKLVYDEHYFYNNGHLNKTGANLFSEMVADSLKDKSF